MEKQIEDKNWLDKVKEALKNLNEVFDVFGKIVLGIASAETAHEKAHDNEVTKEAMRIQKLHSHNFNESDLDRDFDKNDCVLPFEKKYKRALRMWNDWHCYANSGHLVLQSKYYANDIVRPLLRKIKELTAEIDRLKSEAWDDGDIRAAYNLGYNNCLANNRCNVKEQPYLSLDEWLVARRAAKAKE
jgi:hypothetical protein